MNAQEGHAPILKSKPSVLGGTLYAVDCTCGHKDHAGLAWYANRERALAAYARRIAPFGEFA